MQSGFVVLKPTNSTSKYASLPPKNELPDPIHQSSQGVSQFVLIARDAMPQFLGLSVLAVLSVPWLTGLRLTTPLLRPKRPKRPGLARLHATRAVGASAAGGHGRDHPTVYAVGIRGFETDELDIKIRLVAT